MTYFHVVALGDRLMNRLYCGSIMQQLHLCNSCRRKSECRQMSHAGAERMLLQLSALLTSKCECLTCCIVAGRLHLLAVTLDGRRVYFSTSAGGGYGFGAATTARGNPRPTTLRAEIARQAPPQPGAPSTGRVAGHGAAPPSRCLTSRQAPFRAESTVLYICACKDDLRFACDVTATSSTTPYRSCWIQEAGYSVRSAFALACEAHALAPDADI